MAGSLSVIATLMLPAFGLADPGWRPAVAVESAPSATALSFPKIAARPSGCTTVAFERGGTVYASTRPPAGAFSPLQTLSAIAPLEYPYLTAGGDMAAATWEDTASKIRIATAAGCDPLGAGVEVPGSYTFGEDPVAAIENDGTTVVAFQAGGSGSRKIYVSERPAGASPSSPDPLEPPASTEAFRPQIAANGAGAAVVFDVLSSENHVYGTRRLGSSAWSTPVKLSEDEKPAVAGSARVGIGPDGTLHSIWIDAGNKKVIYASLSPGGAVDRTTLIEVGDSVREPAIAVDGEGRLALVWVQSSASSASVKGKYLEPGGSLSAQRNISATSTEFRGNPYVAIDRDGRTIVAWSATATVGATTRTVAATRSPGSNFFSGEAPLSDATENTLPSTISTDADGNTALGLFVLDTPREAKVRAFDAAGPLLRDLSVPAAGQQGEPLAFSISPLDAWSPAAPASWSFGDGSVLGGDSVSHSYAAAGAFAVGVSVADQLGNASEASASTAISARLAKPVEPGPSATAPALSLSLSRKRFRAVPKPAEQLRRKGSGSKLGTQVRYELSEVARVGFAIERRRRAPGGRRFARVGGFQRGGAEGRSKFFFGGRSGGEALAPGLYRLRGIATDRDGERSSPAYASFAILAE